jgi:hypothetical protein
MKKLLTPGRGFPTLRCGALGLAPTNFMRIATAGTAEEASPLIATIAAVGVRNRL